MDALIVSGLGLLCGGAFLFLAGRMRPVQLRAVWEQAQFSAGRLWAGYGRAYLVYLLVVVVSVQFSPFPHWDYPAQLLIGGLVILVARCINLDVRPVMYVLAAVFVVLLLLALPQRGLYGDWYSWNPNALAASAIIPMLYVPLLFWLAVPVLIWISRGAFLGLSVAVLRYNRLWWIPGVLLFIFLLSIRPDTVVVRLRVWWEALQLFAERPLLGWGAGAYHHLALVEPGKIHADNLPLTVLAENGVMGLAALAWLVWEVWRAAPSRAQNALVAVGVHNLVDAPLMVWTVWPVVVLLLADSGATAAPQKGEPEDAT